MAAYKRAMDAYGETRPPIVLYTSSWKLSPVVFRSYSTWLIIFSDKFVLVTYKTFYSGLSINFDTIRSYLVHFCRISKMEDQNLHYEPIKSCRISELLNFKWW